jgi:hypothetical protein
MSCDNDQRDNDNTFADAAIRTAKSTGAGIAIGAVVGGPVGAVIGGIIGAQAGIVYSCPRPDSSDNGSDGNDTCN